MKQYIGWWLVIGLLGLLATANAQTSSPSTASMRFDGTYRFVSAAKLNETYMTRGTTRIGQCPDQTVRPPLVIAGGEARQYSSKGLLQFEGTVGSHGELAMRLTPRPGKKNTPGIEITVNGRVGDDGTVRARQVGYRCNYDLVWRKQAM